MTSLEPKKHYRGTSIGMALIATLDELPKITPQLAEKVRSHFDREILIALRGQRVNRKRMMFKARCHTYRGYDDHWQFVLKDVKCKTDSGRSIKMGCCTINAVSTGLEEERRKAKRSSSRASLKR